MSTQTSLFQQLRAWFAGAIGRDYGLSQLQAAAGRASFLRRPPAVHFNPLGTVHGGYTATLFDAALGLAVYSAAVADECFVTASLEVTYLRPLTAGALPLRTEACVHRREGRQVTAEATLHDSQGQLCAKARAIFMSPRSAQESAPLEHRPA